MQSKEATLRALEPDERRFFRDAFREARAAAQKDAEGFSDIVQALERLGGFLEAKKEKEKKKKKQKLNMGAMQSAIAQLATRSPLADDIPNVCRFFHTPFEMLYNQVRQGRNEAFHEGAIARHLTGDAIILALVLEDALMADARSIGDYMIRRPVCAEMWQPLSFIRQVMLVNSFSHLPVNLNTGRPCCWRLLTDSSIARFTRASSSNERFKRLRMQLSEAIDQGLELHGPAILPPTATIQEALAKCDGLPILVAESPEDVLLGFATPFDLL